MFLIFSEHLKENDVEGTLNQMSDF